MYRLFSSGIVIFLSFLLVFAPYASNAEAANTGVMTLSKLSGDVKVLRGGATVGKPQPGLELAANDEILTGADSTADVRFPSDEVIRIMSNSRVRLHQGAPNQVTVGLSRGKIFNIITKYTDKVTTYKVVTPTATAGVRGTVFSSDVDADETSVFMVKTGNVGVASTTVAGEEVAVNDLMKTVVEKGKLPTMPVALTAAEIATFAIIADLMSGTGAAAGTVAASKAGVSTGTILAVAGGLAIAGAVAAGSSGGGDSDSTPAPTPVPATPETATLAFRLYENSTDDFDMIITKPNGSTIYYFNTAEYSQDSVGGSGPDIAYWSAPLSGTYSIQVQCFSNNNPGVTKQISLEVWKNGSRVSTLLSTSVGGNVSDGSIVGSATYIY